MQNKVFILFLFIIFGCNTKDNLSKQTLNFKTFTIDVPSKWEAIPMNGIDSYVGAIVAENQDTFYFDLGRYSNNLDEYVKIIDADTTLFFAEGIDGAVIQSDSLTMDSLIKTSVSWITIDRKKAKLVCPKKHGFGTTGVHIDSLWNLGNHKIKFTLYGNDLSAQNEKLLLESIKTIKFIR
jgi:hypothetical protein